MPTPDTGAIDRWLNADFGQPDAVPEPLAGLIAALRAARAEELTRNDPVVIEPAERQAAVLILIATDGADGPDVLLQQRSSQLRNHPGQVSFPGGGRDDEDANPTATAVREAVEETGIEPTGVAPLALLPRVHIPPSQFDVTGVLAHWRTPSPIRVVDTNETSRVMRVPFGMLTDPANRATLRTSSGWQGPAFELGDALVWGYTGEILAAMLRMGGWELPWDASRIIRMDRPY